ncbi:MAG: hypothetical protein ABUS79_06385 [Pseudomonadota bacterium]
MTRLIRLTLGLALFGGACTIVAPEGKDASVKIVPFPVPIPRPDALPPPKPLQASVLYVANLQKSSANLAHQYAGIITGLAAFWQSAGLSVADMGLISTYADQYGPRLLLGRSAAAGQPPSSLALLAALAAAADAGVTDYQQLLSMLAPTLGNIDDADLEKALQLLAASGNFEGDGQTSEAKNLIDFGRDLNTASLPSELRGIDRSAFFAVPHDLFIIVYLQPLPRRCALGTPACNVDGRSPADIFLDTNPDGGVSWLSFSNGSILPEQVVQVSIATSEGESQSSFETRCAALPGFPRNLLDVMAPSQNAFFTPLMTALNAVHPGTGHGADFCALIDAKAPENIIALGSSVAALATSHSP